MPLLTITPKDLQSAGVNILYAASHKIIGGAVAYLVIQAAKRIFSPFGDKPHYRLERATLLVSGIVSYSLASQTPLNTFSFRKAVELYLLEVVLNMCCKQWISKKIEIFVPSITGTLGGNLGGAGLGYLSNFIDSRTSLALMGIMGAQSSFSVYNDYRNRPVFKGQDPESFIEKFLA